MLLSSKFKGSKCKTQLKLCVGRIKLLRNKRGLTVKELRKGIAELLRTNQEAAATIRVEHVFREEAVMDAYDALELFCEQVSVRMHMIEASRECPPDLKEAISSLIFAAPRCPDLPELMQVRSLFASKYGKEFVAAASELMANCEVNRQLIGKLSTHPPSGQFKVDLLKKIAEEYDVSWDPEKLQQSLCGADPDLLKGAQSFLSPFNPPAQGGFPAAADSSRKGGDVTDLGRAATESGTAATEARRSGRGSIFATSFISKPGQQKPGPSQQVNPPGIQVSPPASQGYFPTSPFFPPGSEGFSSSSQLYPPDSVLPTPSARSFSDPEQVASASQSFSPHRLQESLQEKESATGSTTRSQVTSFVSPVIPAPDSMKTVAAESVVEVHRPNVTQWNPIVPFPSPVLPSGGTKQTATSEPKSSNSHLEDLLWMGERRRGFEQHGEGSRSEVPKQQVAAGEVKWGKYLNEDIGRKEGRPPVLEFYREEGRVETSQQMRGQEGSRTDRAGMRQHHGKDDDGVKKGSGQRSESMDGNDDEWRRLLLSKARDWRQEKKVGRGDGESSDEEYTDVTVAAAAAVTAAERAASAARAAARLAFRLGEQSMQEKSTDGRGSERKVVYEEAMSVAPKTAEARRSAGHASLHARDHSHLDQADEIRKGRNELRGCMRHKEEHLVMEHRGQDEVTKDEGTGSSGQHACSQDQQPGNELGGEQAIFRQAGWQARPSHGLVEGTKDQDARAGRGVSPSSQSPTTTRSSLDMNRSVEQDGMPDDLSARTMRQPSPERASGAGIGTENYPPSSTPLPFASPQREGRERAVGISVRTRPTSPYAAMRQPPQGSQEGVDEGILKMFSHGPGKNIASAQQPTDQGMQKTGTQQSADAAKERAELQRPTFRLTHSWDDDDDDDDDDARAGGGKVSATRKKNAEDATEEFDDLDFPPPPTAHAEDASEEFDDLDFPSPPTAPVIFKPS
ncbi:hypothetical protein CBR_g37141 [Chara braunii]|uniref:IST1-like protein n=1 Tax=Chara braunii TaxID=69332 RepID=A0A388LM83_CHABU|nr:hypothetical protein CBR_g37141 [Chara braunii]|eukprot:GBG83428.1 hypothetical protein CBR_g37141 [Chara braunii]